MSATAGQADQPAVAFPSFEALRAIHADLLRRQRRGRGSAMELVPEIEEFLLQGQATGALLDIEAERLGAQSLLDYWSSVLERLGVKSPDSTLAEFDPLLAPELDDSLCPYLGLNAFREADHGLFFGRRRIIDECLAHLETSRLLAVVGPSGSGKSSLVMGGLLPQLRLSAVPESDHWRYFPPVAPGSDPLRTLAATVRPPGPPELARRLRDEPGYLAELVGSPSEPSAVLVVDQFEELFTLCGDEGARVAFIDNLLSLMRARDGGGPRQTVILTMRTDFESFVMRVPALQPLFASSRVEVPALSGPELRDAIEKPAELVGLKFEEGIVDELVKQLVGEPAALPLLQFTLLQLWKLRERNRITWQAYRSLGDARQALAISADQFYDALSYEDQHCAKMLLLRMVQPGEGKETTSNRVRRSSLNLAGLAQDRVERVLGKLVDERLVRETRVSLGQMSADDQFEVAHEALVRNWPKLTEWLDDERVRMRRRLRMTSAAEQWRAANNDPALLLRGSQLEEALGFEGLNELEAAFVRASEAMENVRQLTYKGHQIVVRTTYQVEIDGNPIEGHLAVTNDGRVHYPSLPNTSYQSAMDLVRQLIDTFPNEFRS